MVDTTSIVPVALLRIAGWQPDESVDARALDDGVLVHLHGGQFDGDAEELWIELLGGVGDPLLRHDDERGVFFLPDVAEPEDARTYEGVIAAVGDRGKWVHPGTFGDGAEALFEALRSGDHEKLEAERIRLQGELHAAMERISATMSEAMRENPQAALFQAMQTVDPEEYLAAMQSGDPERIRRAIHDMQTKIEEATQSPEPESGPDEPKR